MEAITLRQFQKEDYPFIVDSWLKSYYGHSNFTNSVPRHIFFKEHLSIVNQILTKASISVAVNTEDREVILGYLVFEPKKIHYVYVKSPFRNFGICKLLLFENSLFEDSIVTHLTQKGRKIALKMGYKYSPYFN